MVSKTQSRVEKETEQLSQQMAEQVNRAFEKLEAGDSVFVEHEAAKSLIAGPSWLQIWSNQVIWSKPAIPTNRLPKGDRAEVFLLWY